MKNQEVSIKLSHESQSRGIVKNSFHGFYIPKSFVQFQEELHFQVYGQQRFSIIRKCKPSLAENLTRLLDVGRINVHDVCVFLGASFCLFAWRSFSAKSFSSATNVIKLCTGLRHFEGSCCCFFRLLITRCCIDILCVHN